MSDYNPDPRRPDLYGTPPRYEYTEDGGGRSNVAIIALLAVIALVGGVLFFVEPKPADQQAQVPVPTQTAPMGERPALPAEPAEPRQQ